jgi:hypothetical protein
MTPKMIGTNTSAGVLKRTATLASTPAPKDRPRCAAAIAAIENRAHQISHCAVSQKL